VSSGPASEAVKESSVEIPNIPAAGNVTNQPKSESQTSDQASGTKCPAVAAKPSSTTAQPSAATPRLTSMPSAASEASVKNRSSRDEKSRKKDDKSVDHVLRALNSLNTTEEKLAAMCKKYADIFDEHRKLQVSLSLIFLAYCTE
jgi:hypothetical protein